MKKIFKITSFLLVALIIFINPINIYADTLDDYEAAQAELDRINKEIAELEDTQEAQKAQKANAQSQIDLVKSQIEILNENILQTSEELKIKQEELVVKKEDIAVTDALFQERLKAMYMMNTNGELSTLFGVDTFSEVLITTDTLARISVADTDLLKKLTEEKLIIEQEEKEIQLKLDELEQQQVALEAKTTELASLMQTIDSSLSQTEALQQAASQTQAEVYAEYLAAKQAVESEFGTSVGDFVGGTWLWPVPTNSYISSSFGWRTLYGMSDYHTGIDIASGSVPINGKPIVASNTGVVKTAIYSSRGYGNYVIIDHGGNNFTLYGHCSSLAVGVGDVVAKGQTIAYVGSTGNSTGPHLHFEIRLNGQQIDPYSHIAATRP